MINLILFPSSYLNKTRVDEDLQAEYEAVINTGLFDAVFFSYDDWFNHGKLSLTTVPEKLRKAVYRGWMMKPDKYAEFYKELKENNIELITKPDEYEAMHVFPNVYELVKEDTAKMEVFSLHKDIDVENIKKSFKRFMVKDFVKSVKGTDFPKFFDDSVTQKDFNDWMEVFYKYRGNLLTGGICIKEYLDLKKYGDRPNEFRVFYVDGKVLTESRNSGQISMTKNPPDELVDKYKNLPSGFYTVDFAELEDGSWVVIEAGDGSVSGLSEGQDYEAYFRALYHCLN